MYLYVIKIVLTGENHEAIILMLSKDK